MEEVSAGWRFGICQVNGELHARYSTTLFSNCIVFTPPNSSPIGITYDCFRADIPGLVNRLKHFDRRCSLNQQKTDDNDSHPNQTQSRKRRRSSSLHSENAVRDSLASPRSALSGVSTASDETKVQEKYFVSETSNSGPQPSQHDYPAGGLQEQSPVPSIDRPTWNKTSSSMTSGSVIDPSPAPQNHAPGNNCFCYKDNFNAIKFLTPLSLNRADTFTL